MYTEKFRIHYGCISVWLYDLPIPINYLHMTKIHIITCLKKCQFVGLIVIISNHIALSTFIQLFIQHQTLIYIKLINSLNGINYFCGSTSMPGPGLIHKCHFGPLLDVARQHDGSQYIKYSISQYLSLIRCYGCQMNDDVFKMCYSCIY